MDTVDLFKEGAAAGPGNAPESGLLVTNHLNLMYMLAAGLLMPPAGFGDKYYRDPLACFPGWIPLFVGKAPREAIESATREAGHLRPVLVEVRLGALSGRVMAAAGNGLEGRCFPDHCDGRERVLLVPAPLPTSWIESIVFPSLADKKRCEREAQDFGNVPLADFRRRTAGALFARASDAPWPPPEGPAERSVPLAAPLAAGGAAAMLLLFGNLGEQALRACRRAFEPADEPGFATEDHPILAGLAPWVRDGAFSLPAPADAGTDRAGLQKASQAWLFWGAVERLVREREKGGAQSAEDLLLDHLAAAGSRLDPRLRAGVARLRDTLESLTGLAGATASEIFERHDTPLAHAMTLFFLRRECPDLFDYRSERLGETGWLAAAILFGVREGWLRLPLRLRAFPGLPAALAHRMARLSHRIAGTGLDLGTAPERVRPLRELLGDASAWRAREKSAALALARAQGWECVHTRIRLGPGEYRLRVQGGSMLIEVSGEPRIAPEVDRARFFDLLADARLEPGAEAPARKILRG